MVEFVNFKVFSHPLGGEIDISYDYSEPITDNDKTYVFKKDAEINDEDIFSFLDSNTNPGNLEIWLIQNYIRKTWDYKVETDKNYYYKAIIQREITQEDDSVVVERSNIVETKITQLISEVILHTIPVKQIVMDGIGKLVKAIVENLNKKNPEGNRVELSIWDHYPVISGQHSPFFVVTRASSDEGARYWSNVYYQDKDIMIKGDVESETINVTWMTINNSIMRDQLTNIMRGAKFWLYRYLRRQFDSGVLSVAITMMADGDENPQDQLHLFYSGMLIHFLIDTKMIVKQPSELLENVKIALDFKTEQPNG